MLITNKHTGFKAFANISYVNVVSVFTESISGVIQLVLIFGVLFICVLERQSLSVSLPDSICLLLLMWMSSCDGSLLKPALAPPADLVFRLSSTMLQAVLGLHPLFTKITKHDGSSHRIFALGDVLVPTFKKARP